MNKFNLNTLPFVSGFALQNYHVAEEGLLEAYKNNYSYWYIDGGLDEEKVANWDDNRINSLKEMIAIYNVKPIYHGNFKIPLASDVDELRESAINYTKREIDLAAKLSAPIIIHGSVIVEPRLVVKAKKQALENYLKTLHVLHDYASKQGVQILLENLSNYKNYRPFHYIFTQDEEYEFILNETDLPLFFDVGHANVCEGTPNKIIEKYHRRIAGMSFSNNDGVRDLHLGLNKGTIDYYEIVSTILRCGWHGIIGFETRDRSPRTTINDLVSIYEAVREPIAVNEF